MLTKLFSFVAKTIVFFLFVGWVLSKTLFSDLSLVPPNAGTAVVKPNTGAGLIIPEKDPNF